MTQLPIRKLSLLSIVLIAASAVTAAIVPNTSEEKRANDGTLRVNSATAAGADQDAGAGVVSCIPEIETLMSCTATASCTTTGFFAANSCCVLVEGFYHQTIGNTSQTGGPTNGNQNSVLEICL